MRGLSGPLRGHFCWCLDTAGQDTVISNLLSLIVLTFWNAREKLVDVTFLLRKVVND